MNLFKDFYRKEIEIDGYPAILEILDTAGTEQFASMRDLYIKNGQGFVIVYSLTSKQSFNDSKLIRDQILRVKGTERVPIVLAANKSDLNGPQREVTTEEGFSLANEWCVPYIETSAKNSTIVNCLFAEIVKEMNLKSNINYGNKKDRKKSKKLSLPVLDGTNKTNSSDSSYSNSLKETTNFKKPKSGFIKSHLCFGCCRLKQDKSKNCNSSNNNIIEYSFSDKNSPNSYSSCSIL